MVRLTDRPDITIAVDWDIKKQTERFGYNTFIWVAPKFLLWNYTKEY